MSSYPKVSNMNINLNMDSALTLNQLLELVSITNSNVKYLINTIEKDYLVTVCFR